MVSYTIYWLRCGAALLNAVAGSAVTARPKSKAKGHPRLIVRVEPAMQTRVRRHALQTRDTESGVVRQALDQFFAPRKAPLSATDRATLDRALGSWLSNFRLLVPHLSGPASQIDALRQAFDEMVEVIDLLVHP